jgi:hypothetical protein
MTPEIKRQTIKVGVEERKKKTGFFLVAFRLIAILVFCVMVAQGLDVAYRWVKVQMESAHATVVEKLTITKVVTEYRDIDDATLEDLIKKVAAEFQVDPLILQVLADKESAGGKKLYRFEPEKFKELQSHKRYRGLSSDELRMIASSHGIFHVMGYSAREYCDLNWHQLYNHLASARCAASIVARLYDDTRDIDSSGARVRQIFRKYNGSGESAERYANDAMQRLASLLYRGIAKG